MKFPYLPLFVSDFLSDPKLSLCSAMARGVWIDFLCVMHMNDRCGVITGTREQLARLGRCSTVEVSSAIDELKHTESADVTERNRVVTVICRRMKRASEARQHGRLRVQRHRESKDVTDKETSKPPLEYRIWNVEYGSLKGESEGKLDWPRAIYEAFPRKVGKPNAIRAIQKALKGIEPSKLLEITKAYSAASAGCDPAFIPHPATWFNQERFNDDPLTWATKPQGKSSSSSSGPILMGKLVKV